MKLFNFDNKLIPFQVKVNLNYVDFKAEEFVWLNLLPLGSDNYVSISEGNYLVSAVIYMKERYYLTFNEITNKVNVWASDHRGTSPRLL